MITIETRSGKRAYETVAERVKKFRATYPVDSGWQLQTEIEFPSEGLVLCRAKIIDPDGRLVATGTAEETRGSNFINKTSAVENAETSAIGRALFAAGFGGGEFCSADELMTAMKRQEELMAVESEARKSVRKKSGAPKGDQAPEASEDEDFGSQFAPPVLEPEVEISPDSLNLPEDSGIELVLEGNLLIARDARKGATFTHKELLKSAGFSFDRYQRVWYKKVAAEETVS